MSPWTPEKYPANWGELRTAAVEAAGKLCQGCGCAHAEDGTPGTYLTVHHPDRDPENPEPRLTVLCARCHLSVEGIARRRERVHASREPGESLAAAWKRAQTGVSAEQLELA